MKKQNPDIVLLIKRSALIGSQHPKIGILSISNIINEHKLDSYRIGDKIKVMTEETGEQEFEIKSISFFISKARNEFVIELNV